MHIAFDIDIMGKPVRSHGFNVNVHVRVRCEQCGMWV